MTILYVKSPEETMTIAQKIVLILQLKDIILLSGDLGVGKSFFARSLIQFFLNQNIAVPSPSFNFVQHYEGKCPLWHFDLYRLKDENELLEIGLEEAYATGISIIEWPERLGQFYPKSFLHLHLAFGKEEKERIFTLTTKGNWKERIKSIFS